MLFGLPLKWSDAFENQNLPDEIVCTFVLEIKTYNLLNVTLTVRQNILKEYSVILTTSFYVMNQKTNKAYFQNFK